MIIPVPESIYKNHQSHNPNSSRCIQKKKVSRTMFTTQQIIAMEEIFKFKSYICREERVTLAQRIQVDEGVIEAWFHNRRHMSEKRILEAEKPDPVLPVAEERLVYIEQLISERTDQSGCVFLDDILSTELGDVLDKYLP